MAPHVRTFLVLALYTAARAAAILDLTWPQVDFAGNLIDLGAVAGGKSRAIVPMGPTLKAELLKARELATCPFVIEHGGQQVASVKTGTRAAAVRAGLPGVTPHILRHTAASWMARKGVPMRDIAKYLGHGDSRITERTYAKHSPDWLRDAAAALEA
jgi:integrase